MRKSLNLQEEENSRRGKKVLIEGKGVKEATGLLINEEEKGKCLKEERKDGRGFIWRE